MLGLRLFLLLWLLLGLWLPFDLHDPGFWLHGFLLLFPLRFLLLLQLLLVLLLFRILLSLLLLLDSLSGLNSTGPLGLTSWLLFYNFHFLLKSEINYEMSVNFIVVKKLWGWVNLNFFGRMFVFCIKFVWGYEWGVWICLRLWGFIEGPLGECLFMG